jgi:hypothetical protein
MGGGGGAKIPACPVCKCPTCPACPNPVYDQNTCGSLINDAVNAKKCPSMVGLQYNNSNKDVEKILVALQNVINKLQEILCTSDIKFKLLESIKKMPLEWDQPVNIFLVNLKQAVIQATPYDGLMVDRIKIDQVRSLMFILAETIISINTVNGYINSAKLKLSLISVLNSICLDYKEIDRNMIPPPEVSVKPIYNYTPSQPYVKSSFGASNSNQLWWLILLIIIPIVFLAYRNKDKIRIPSLDRQISNFGRQMKSIRRM